MANLYQEGHRFFQPGAMKRNPDGIIQATINRRQEQSPGFRAAGVQPATPGLLGPRLGIFTDRLPVSSTHGPFKSPLGLIALDAGQLTLQIPPAAHAGPHTKSPHPAPRYAPRRASARDVLIAHAHSRTPYDVNEAELHIIQSENIGEHSPGYRALPPRLMKEHALARLSARPSKNSEFHQALQRLHALRASGAVSWDVPIKVFNDIDTILFHADLRHRVNLKWQDLRTHFLYHKDRDRSPYDTRETAAISYPPVSETNPRVQIRLNTNSSTWEGRMNFVIGTLVHEMIHAWYYVHCGEDGCNDIVRGPGETKGHGWFFHAARKVVARRLVGCGFEGVARAIV